jgi:hypothetical protein
MGWLPLRRLESLTGENGCRMEKASSEAELRSTLAILSIQLLKLPLHEILDAQVSLRVLEISIHEGLHFYG